MGQTMTRVSPFTISVRMETSPTSSEDSIEAKSSLNAWNFIGPNKRVRFALAIGLLFIFGMMIIQPAARLFLNAHPLHLPNYSSSNGTIFFSLFLIVSFGVLGGKLADKAGYAPMIGMLFAGMFLRNAFSQWIVEIPHTWTSKMWTLSLAAVISRAGLSLELKMLKKNAKAVLLLGSVPVLIEAMSLATLGHYLFHLPLDWSFIMAFGVASISPGVVVPLILTLLEVPAWSRSRLPPLMLAATGVDVLIATTGFGIAFASAFKHSHEHEDENSLHDSWIVRGIEEIMGGLVLGLVMGLFALILKHLKYNQLISNSCMFFASSIIMGWGKANGMTGVASSSIIISWATVANSWDAAEIEVVDKRLKSIWNLFKPFLFPVIGASVSLAALPMGTFLTCFGLVVVSVMIKGLSAFVVGALAHLDLEERVFVSGTWTGKASVQAALCNAALEVVHRRNLQGTIEETYAQIVFMAMVSAILVGGPFAGLWVGYFGKKVVGIGKHVEISTTA